MTNQNERSFIKFLIKFWLYILLFCVIIIFTSGGIAVYKYFQWADSFEGQHLSTDYVYFTDESIDERVNEKIKHFNVNQNSNKYIEFTNDEFLFLLGTSIDYGLGDALKVGKGYIEDLNDGKKIYIYMEVANNYGLWLVFDLVKDNPGVESTDLSIKNFKIGNIPLKWGNLHKNINFGFQNGAKIANDCTVDQYCMVNIEMFTNAVVFRYKKQLYL